jgi:hypothetical protein
MQEFIASDKDIVLEATVETTWETIEALLKNPFRLVGQPFGIKTNNAEDESVIIPGLYESESSNLTVSSFVCRKISIK